MEKVDLDDEHFEKNRVGLFILCLWNLLPTFYSIAPAFTPVEQVPVMRTSAAERAASTAASLKEPLHSPRVIPQTEIHGRIPDNPTFRKLMEHQRVMSREDGLYVWKKLPRDRAMYSATLFLCGACTLTLGYMFKTLIWPPAKKD